jgi:ribulose-phosphate 3-epimerase
MNEVIPGILEKEWSEIEHKLELVKPFAKTVHIDIIDGKFVDNTTFLDPEPFKKYSKNFLLELHMMVENPLIFLKPWAEAGFQRFIGHIEKMPDPVEFVAQGQLLGSVGLALDGPTDSNVLDNINLADLDCILIYTSEHVGFSGPELLDVRLDKIRKIKEKYEFIPIEVDGGINSETIIRAYEAGASRFVSTSYLFKTENIKETFEKLTSQVFIK